MNLRAIEFLSTTDGVGLAASSLHRPSSPSLAVTTDGGESWRTKGTPLPITSRLLSTTVAFVSPTVGFVDDGQRLFGTSDGGATWRPIRLGGAVPTISRRGNSLWALVLGCPARSTPIPSHCPAWIDTTTVGAGGAGSWQPHRLPVRAIAAADPSLSRLGGSYGMLTGLLWPDDSANPVLVTTDSATHWTVKASPCASPPPVRLAGGLTIRRYWLGPGSLTGSQAERRQRWWLMCDGGAAAGTATKGVERTPNLGDAWSQVAAFSSIGPRMNRGHLPTGDAGVLVAFSATQLWLTDANGLAGSADGGRTWTTVRGVDLAGAGSFSAFSVVDRHHGWLLAPGTGLWRTVDGLHWTSVD